MGETKQCPYCGEEILIAAKKCKHCGEWLTSEVPLTGQSGNTTSEVENVLTKEEKALQLPKSSKLWGWFIGILTIGVVRSLLNAKSIRDGYFDTLDATWDFILFWGFLLLLQYMKNFEQKIPLLKFLPWCFLLSGIGTIIFTDEFFDDVNVGAVFVIMMLLIGIIVYEFYIARQLSKFTGEPTRGIKTLGEFMFISCLFEVMEFFSSLFIENESVLAMVPLFGITLSFVTCILLLRVFRKARQYNEQHFGIKSKSTATD